MPLGTTFKSSREGRVGMLQVDEVRRNYVIKMSGVEDPSPTFIEDFLAGGLSQSTATADYGGDSSSRLGIDTVAAQYQKPDYTLESLAGLDPNDPLAKHIVQTVMGIEDASPSMIHDIMRDAGLATARPGAPSPEGNRAGYEDPKIYTKDYTYICQCDYDDDDDISSCPHTEGHVTVLHHEADVNDLASGALPSHVRDRRSSLSPTVVVPVSPQDAVACKSDWESLAKYQPNGLLSLQLLIAEGLFSERLLDGLPSRYHTTVTGLLRAFDDLTRPEDEEEEEADEEMILNALFIRGGEPADSNTVVYAEELVPYVGHGEAEYDAVFWEGIEMLRRENAKSGLVDLLAWAHEVD